MNDAVPKPPPPELDPIAQAILDFLCLQEPPADVKPIEVVKFVATKRARRAASPNLWRRYLPAVRQQGKFLARQGRILIIHRGQPADPNSVKGLVRYRLVETDAKVDA